MKIMCIYTRLTTQLSFMLYGCMTAMKERTLGMDTLAAWIALSLPYEEVSEGCLSCLEMFISSNSVMSTISSKLTIFLLDGYGISLAVLSNIIMWKFEFLSYLKTRRCPTEIEQNSTKSSQPSQNQMLPSAFNNPTFRVPPLGTMSVAEVESSSPKSSTNFGGIFCNHQIKYYFILH